MVVSQGEGALVRVSHLGFLCVALQLVLLTAVGAVAQVDISIPSTFTTNDALRVRICQIALGESPIGTGAAAVAITEFPRYAAMYPNISWEYSLLSKNGNLAVPDLAQAILDATSRCTAYLGPINSQQAVATAPLIDKVWVSDIASSTELSNKDTFPTFSRVATTAASLGRALAAYTFQRGWTQASVVVSDETYGISVAFGFSDAFLDSGGKLDMTFAVSSSDAGESLRAALRRIKAEAKSRVVLLAYLQGVNISDIIVSEEMHRNFIFLFGESLCALESIKSTLSGAICAIGTQNATGLATLKASVLAQPAGYFQNLSVPPLSLQPFTGPENLSELSGFTSDALGFLMKGFNLMLESVGWNATAFRALSTATLISQIRNRTKLEYGITGEVRMDSKGDRLGGQRTIFQIQPKGQLAPLAQWDDLNGLRLSLPMDHWLYWMNESIPGPAPSWSRHEGRNFVVDPLVLIGSAIAACLVVIVSVAAIRLQCSSDEAKFRALRSGASWALIGGLTVRLADTVADIVSFITVVLRDPPESDIFLGFYGALIVLGVMVSLLEIQYMIRYFHVTLLDDELTEVETVHWRLRLKRSHLMNVFADDLPMLIISAVALQSAFNWLVLVNMIFSCVLVGMSLDLVLEVARIAVEHDQKRATAGEVEGESPTGVQPAPTPTSSATSSKKRLSGAPIPHNPFSAIGGSQGKSSLTIPTIPSAVGTGGLRRVKTIFALDYRPKKSQSLSAIGPQEAGGNEDDATEEAEPDETQVKHLVSVLDLRAPDRLRFALTKADEDAVWISSMNFSSEIFYAVFLQRLKCRLLAQDDEFFEQSRLVKEDSKELGLLLGPNFDSLEEGSILVPPPLPVGNQQSTGTLRTRILSGELDLGPSEHVDSSGEGTPSTGTTPRNTPRHAETSNATGTDTQKKTDEAKAWDAY